MDEKKENEIFKIDNMSYTTYNKSKSADARDYDKELDGDFIIDFYEKENGEAPAEEFIQKLDSKMQAKVFKILDILEKNGPAVRFPYSEHLQDGIFEIRAKQGSNITRILYFFWIGRKIILTNGFVKKTQKTPTKELVLAKKYRADYERRFAI